MTDLGMDIWTALHTGRPIGAEADGPPPRAQPPALVFTITRYYAPIPSREKDRTNDEGIRAHYGLFHALEIR